MAATTLTFGKVATPTDVPIHRVYLRTNWSDAWALESFLYPVVVTWQAAPGLSIAEMDFRYGTGMREGENAFSTITRLAKQRHFVRIDFIDGAKNRKWYGVLELDSEELEGTEFPAGANAIAHGKQRLVAYGLERLLQQHVIRSSDWTSPTDLGTIHRGLIFNDRAVGNMDDGGDPLQGFEGDDTATGTYWSTRDIVTYLLTYQTPTDGAGLNAIPFRLDDPDNALPDWDQPVVAQHNRRTRDVINSLVTRQRLISYWLDVDEGPDPHEIVLKPFTFTDAQILIDGGPDAIEANPETFRLVFDRDPSADCVITTSSLDAVDQVIVTGARRRCCFTASNVDGTIVAGWTSGQQTAYDTAASGAGDYPGAGQVQERQRRNIEARSAPKLEDVYARFKLPDNWDLKANNGLNTGTDLAVAPINDLPTDVEPFPLYRPEIRILPTIPLADNTDYSGVAISIGTFTQDGDGPFEDMAPIVAIELPEDTGRYVRLDKMGLAAFQEESNGSATDRTWSAFVRTTAYDKSLYVQVSGQEQHVLGKNTWTSLGDAHGDTDIAKFDWKDLLFTIAIEDDRFCEAHFPLDVDLDPNLDAPRRMHIDAGDAYKMDFVVDDTIVAIDETDGSLKRTTVGGFVRDDSIELLKLAERAYQWYSVNRVSMQFQTAQFQGTDLELGDYVTDIGDSTVAGPHDRSIGSAVTSITIEVPLAEGGGRPGPITTSYSCQFAEFDALS